MKNFWRNLLLLGGLTVLFSSCGLLLLISLVFFQPVYPPCSTCTPKPESISFTTDLRVLRGDWRSLIRGDTEFDPGKQVNLTLEATYMDTASYTVTGTFQVAGDTALTVQGLVKGGDFQAFTKSANRTRPLPPKAFAEFLLSNGAGQAATQVLIFCPYTYQGSGGLWQYQAVLEPITADRVPFQSCYGSTSSSKRLIVGRKPAAP